MKRNRKMILTLTLSLLFLFTCSLLTFFATEADNGSVAIQEENQVVRYGLPDSVVASVASSVSTPDEPMFRPINWPWTTDEFFNDDISTACQACHRSENRPTADECFSDGRCDCLSENGCIQCCGYANYLFHFMTGYYPNSAAYVTNESSQYKNKVMSAALVAELEQYHTPIYVNLTYRGASKWGHYLCIVDFTETGLYFCDANGFERGTNGFCRVKNGLFMTYEAFANRYSDIREVIFPNDCHFSYYADGNQHVYSCTGCEKDQIVENHNMVGYSCTDCYASNVHRNHETAWTVTLTHHWTRCITCNDLQITDTQQHTFVNHRCSVCGMMDALINKVPGDTEVN